jgi:hypothetical protein
VGKKKLYPSSLESKLRVAYEAINQEEIGEEGDEKGAAPVRDRPGVTWVSLEVSSSSV